MTGETAKINPTQTLDLSFSAYVKKRKTEAGKHLVGGIPDYAYGVDYELMRKVNAIPGAYKLLKALASSYVPMEKQKCNLNYMKVGPTQSPKVYEMTRECAERLKIGVPEVFIEPSASVLNAYTLASEDSAPIIVVSSGLVERFTPEELKFVIGHECGHIHNNHSIYSVATDVVLGSIVLTGISGIPGINQILNIAMIPLRLTLNAWMRAAEVTADRAGVICVDDFNDAINAQCKLLYGAPLKGEPINVEAIIKQYDRMRSTPVRMLELTTDHPSSVRRILAIMEFLNSEVLCSWRPEQKKADAALIGKQELDARCEKYVSVTKSEKRRG